MTTPPWYQYACAEASIDHAKSNLAKTDANDSGRLKKRSVFVRSDRMWENGTVRANVGLVTPYSLTYL